MISKMRKQNKESYVLIDVRMPEEAAEGMLEGALNIPFDQLPNHLNSLDKNKEIYVYCTSGNRSESAASLLKEHGFKSYNLGGYLSLKEM